MTPELTAQLSEIYEAGIAEAIAGSQAELQERYERMIHDHQAGYRDSDIWRRAEIDRDKKWLDAIIRLQAGVNPDGMRWQLLQDLACEMVPGNG